MTGASGDALPVQVGAVVAVEVDDLVAAATGPAQLGVITRDAEVGDDHVVVSCPADAQLPNWQAEHGAWAAVDASPRRGYRARRRGRRSRSRLYGGTGGTGSAGWGRGTSERTGYGCAVWLPDGRGGLHLNRRRVRACRSSDERAPEQWTVIGMAKANRARTGNGNLTDPLPIHERAIRTPGVMQLPAATLPLDNGVLPGNPRVRHDDVRLRVTADPVGRSRLQQLVDAGALDVQLLTRDTLRDRLGTHRLSGHRPVAHWLELSCANCRASARQKG